MSRADRPGIVPLGDRAIVLRFGEPIDAATVDRVLSAWRSLAASAIAGIVDWVPAYTTLTAHYDWRRLPDPAQPAPWQWLADTLLDILEKARPSEHTASRTITLPVCYQPPHAPDLDDLAAATGLSVDDIVARHCSVDYRVAFLGFRPGFPYLLGLDPALSAPRLTTPRVRIEAGSVGIGGAQTGIYPTAGPGGWRLIGRTPSALFDTASAAPTLLAPGDRLRFTPIDASEFERLAQASRESATPAFAAADAAIDIIAPGIHTTVQDLGRPGSRHLGIGAGGVSDPVAATLANALVGNDAGAALLEMTLRGPDLLVHSTVTLALTGAGMSAFVDGAPIGFARPVTVAAGSRISFRASGDGARAWLAVSGGIDAPRWLGSAATDTGSKAFGRPLQAGDRLAVLSTPPGHTPAGAQPVRASAWWIDAQLDHGPASTLRFIADAEAGASLLAELSSRSWQATTAADRTGVRLDGPSLSLQASDRRISAAVLHGTIQVPPDGRPIVLGPDGQTVGGYPVAGHVIEADLPRLAQVKPGDRLRLMPVTLEDAHQLRRAQGIALARLQLAISGKLRRHD